MRALIDLRQTPETPLMAGLLVCVLFAQSLLPVHTRIATDPLGLWTVVCRWLDRNADQHDGTQRAPGFVFSSLAAELLAPGLAIEAASGCIAALSAEAPNRRPTPQPPSPGNRIRAPPQRHDRLQTESIKRPY